MDCYILAITIFGIILLSIVYVWGLIVFIRDKMGYYGDLIGCDLITFFNFLGLWIFFVINLTVVFGLFIWLFAHILCLIHVCKC